MIIIIIAIMIVILILFFLFRKKEKKYVLAVCAIFKNESWNIKEWIEHYMDEGVEHFYLINNNSTDDYKSILRPYINDGLVSLFQEKRSHIQVDAYNDHVLPVARRETEWLIVCDLDEFIYSRHGTIRTYLQSLSDDTSVVCVPWKMFGSNGHVKHPEGGIVRNFTKRRLYNDNDSINVKNIMRVDKIKMIMVHSHEPTSGQYIRSDGIAIHPNDIDSINEDILSSSVLHLNHYAIQSREYFEKIKMTRGDISNAALDHVRNDDYFKNYDWNELRDEELKEKRLSRCTS